MAAKTDITPVQLDAATAVENTADQLPSMTALVVVIFTCASVVVFAMFIGFHKRKKACDMCAKPASAKGQGKSERLLSESHKPASGVPDTQHATIGVPSPAYSSYPASTQSSTNFFPSTTGKHTLSESTSEEAVSPLLSESKKELRHFAVDTPSSDVRQQLFTNEVVDEANDDAAQDSEAKAQGPHFCSPEPTTSQVVARDPWQAAVAANSMRSKLQLLAEMPSPPPLVVEAKGDGLSVKAVIVSRGDCNLQLEFDSSTNVEAVFLAQNAKAMSIKAVAEEATLLTPVKDDEKSSAAGAACVADAEVKASDLRRSLPGHADGHDTSQEDNWMVQANMAGNVWEAAVAASPLRVCLQQMAGMKTLPPLVLDPLAGSCKAHAAKVVSAKDGTIMLSGTSFAEVEALLSTNVTHKAASGEAVQKSSIVDGSHESVTNGKKSVEAFSQENGASSDSLLASSLPRRTQKWLEVEPGVATQLWQRVSPKMLRGAIVALLSLVILFPARRRLRQVIRRSLRTR